jgi:hypothetical protein
MDGESRIKDIGISEVDNLLCPNELLKVSNLPGKPVKMLDPNTEEPFEGTSYFALPTVFGMASITYVQFRNGLREGLYVHMMEDGRVLSRFEMSRNLFHGKSECFYMNGLPKSFKDYRIANSTHSKLLELKVWKPDGRRCPHSRIDRNGDGIYFHYQEDGTVGGIMFYSDFQVRAEIFYKDKGQFDGAWVYERGREYKELSIV